MLRRGWYDLLETVEANRMLPALCTSHHRMPKIDRILCYVMADSDEDDEGIPAFLASNGLWMTMIGADESRILSLREQAQAIADGQGKSITLLRFTKFEVVDVIQPKSKPKPKN
jgi:hypothetical protein